MAHPFRSLTTYDLASAAPVAVSGEISQKVVVVTRSLKEDHKTFLSKILTAVKLTKNDFAIVEFEEDADFRLSDHLSIKDKTILFFGVTPHAAGLSLKTQSFQVIRGYSFICLFCDPIEKIAENQQFKRQLWEALKDIFPQEEK